MNLNTYAAQKKREIFDRLMKDLPPSEGEFDEVLWRDAKSKGRPQMGTTVYLPDSITVEFIYSNPQGSPTIVPVKLAAPERIVFLPVPEWVVETIWQGEISGTYHFESDATKLVEAFRAQTEPEANKSLFGPQMAKRRE